MIFTRSKTRWLLLASVSTMLAGCQQTSSIGIDVSSVSAAPFCKVVAGLDLRASRKDTKPTQRTLYQLQQAQVSCQ